jgi:glycosyltransferase 2 family protein
MTRRFTLLASLGALGLVVLLWRIDLNAVKLSLLHVGWGMTLVLGQEIVAHVLNAWGWRFAFTREAARHFPLSELIRLRVAGDAINYLTPTATIGGEVARTALLSDASGVETRAVSVIIAKTSQTLAQGFFTAAGLALVAAEWITLGRGFLPWVGVGLLAVTLVAFRLKPRLGGMAMAWWRALGPNLTGFIREHPGRVALSILMFTTAYAWGAFEVYWICRSLGTPVAVGTALTIEVLSITIDGLFFMVPAKIGTQETGKVVVFAALGLSPSLGLAFGIVRHVRELLWACAGVLLYCAAIRRESLSSLGRLLARSAAPTGPGE